MPDLRLPGMKIEYALDRIHSKTVRSKFLQLFTSFTRVLLALAFIPPSIPKIMHQPFTILPNTDPVGHYFDALYKTGFYYDFIGWTQITAAILLLIPRTAHFGALMFLPIIVNVTVLTNSVGFRGTWLITILMTLACVYLICWDYPRWKSLFFSSPKAGSEFSLLQLTLIPFVFAGAVFIAVIGGAAVTGRLSELNIFVPLVLALGGLIFGLFVALHQRFLVVEPADSGVGQEDSNRSQINRR